MSSSLEKPLRSSFAGLQSVREQTEESPLSVQGTIPEWLEGVLYRTGPGQFEVGNDEKRNYNIKHWFDGKALNHRFAISGKENKVMYRSRFACSDQILKENQTGRPSSITFAQSHDPCERLYTKFNMAFRSLMGLNRPTSASDTNVNVVIQFDHSQRNRLLVKTDYNALQKLDATTLEPIDTFAYDHYSSELQGQLTAAHAATIDGVSYNFILKFGPRPCYKIFSLDGQGKVKILNQIFDAPLAYLHSLAVTENHIIFSVWQADIGLKGLGVPWKNNVLDCINKWKPGRKTIHYIINRHTGKMIGKHVTDAFFAFHHINASESANGQQVVLDLATFEDTKILDLLNLENMREWDASKHEGPQFRRIILPLNENSTDSSQTISGTQLLRTDINIELPTVHPDKRWRNARFAYGIHHTNKSESRHLFVDAVIKLQLDHPSLNETSSKHTDPTAYKVWSPDGMVPGEPIFIPRPGNSTEEDDGVVLTVVLEPDTERSQLVILDAKTLEVVAQASMPCAVPFGFHGTFAPSETPSRL